MHTSFLQSLELQSKKSISLIFLSSLKLRVDIITHFTIVTFVKLQIYKNYKATKLYKSYKILQKLQRYKFNEINHSNSNSTFEIPNCKLWIKTYSPKVVICNYYCGREVRLTARKSINSNSYRSQNVVGKKIHNSCQDILYWA